MIRSARSGHSCTGSRRPITAIRSASGTVGAAQGEPADPGPHPLRVPAAHDSGEGEPQHRARAERGGDLPVGRHELGRVALLRVDPGGELRPDHRARGRADDQVGVGEVDAVLARTRTASPAPRRRR